MLDMEKDTERLSGGFRSIETKVRMIKERKDNKKYSDLKFHQVLKLITPQDGFSKEEIDLLVAANRVSGSMAHGNYAEAIEKMDKFILPVYFKNAQLKKGSAKKIDLTNAQNGKEILDTLMNGTRTPVITNPGSDIFEAYVAAKADGYLTVMEELIKCTMKMVDSKLPA